MFGELSRGEKTSVPRIITLPLLNGECQEPALTVTALLSTQAQTARNNISKLKMTGYLAGSDEITSEEMKATIRERLLTDGSLDTDQFLQEFFGHPGLNDADVELDFIRLQHCCETGEWLGPEYIEQVA